MLSLISKILQCTCWKALYSLDDEFINNGLKIHITENGHRALCRVSSDGSIISNKIIDDFIFIESEYAFAPISPYTLEMIVSFVKNNASNNQILDQTRTYRRNVGLYGTPIFTKKSNELMQEQFIRYISESLNEI